MPRRSGYVLRLQERRFPDLMMSSKKCAYLRDAAVSCGLPRCCMRLVSTRG